MDNKIIAVNLFVPLLVILIIGVIAGCFRLKKKESIKSGLFDTFARTWEKEEKEEQ